MPVNSSDPGIDRFIQALERICTEREKKTLRQAQERRAGLLATAAERIEREAEYTYRERAEAIAKATAAQRSAQVSELRRQLFRLREELADCVFAAAKERLVDFAAGPNYEKFMLDLALNLAMQRDCSDGVISLRSKDIGLAAELKRAFSSNCKVQSSDEILLGGLMIWLPQQKLLIDERLETRLEEQRAWFYEHSGLVAAW